MRNALLRGLEILWGFGLGCYMAYAAFGNKGAGVFVATYLLLWSKPWSEK